MRIDLYLDSIWIKNVIDEVSAHNPYYWRVWQGTEYSNTTYTRYQIRIQDPVNPNYIGFSPFFTITNEKYLDVLTPTTNSSYSSGDSVNITWITDTPCSEVHIQLKKDGKTVHNITTTSNNGKFTWKVPARFKTNSKYQIFLKAEDNSAWASSGFFKITQKIIPSYNLFILLASIFLVSICIIVRKKLWNKI